MPPRQPRYSKAEFTRRGTELYEQKIRPLVGAGNRGRYVVIDIETGDYELGDDPLILAQSIIAKRPDAQLWCVRIDHRAVATFGFYSTAEKP